MTDIDATVHPCCSAGTRPEAGEPDWEPLLAAVGDHVAGPFMWMYRTVLEHGPVVHAYKHAHTRRYLFLTAELDAFRYSACGGYSPARLDEAIEEALCGWFLLSGMEPEDGPAIGEAVRRAAELRNARWRAREDARGDE